MNLYLLIPGAIVILILVGRSLYIGQRIWKNEHHASHGGEWASTLYVASGYFFALAIAGWIMSYAIAIGLLIFAYLSGKHLG